MFCRGSDNRSHGSKYFSESEDSHTAKTRIKAVLGTRIALCQGRYFIFSLNLLYVGTSARFCYLNTLLQFAIPTWLPHTRTHSLLSLRLPRISQYPKRQFKNYGEMWVCFTLGCILVSASTRFLWEITYIPLALFLYSAGPTSLFFNKITTSEGFIQ